MKRLIALIMFAAFLTPLMAQYTDADVEAYVEKYKDYAIQAQEKYKIPASIKLAQAIYSSACGTNRLATEGLNHFGITCRGGWSGETFYYDNIHTTADDCFRKYASVEASYQNHSVFLASRERYADLFKLDITDYKGWAHGLKAAGYATSPTYAAKLIQIIEDYNLTELDQAALGKKHHAKPVQAVTTPSVPQALSHGQHNICFNNRNYYIVARPGDTFESLAKEYGVSARKLRRNNEVYKHHQLSAGDIVYFEKKQKRADKIYKKKYHALQAGESLYGISQKYGMRLKTLYTINKLEPGYTSKVGDRIRLR